MSDPPENHRGVLMVQSDRECSIANVLRRRGNMGKN